MSGYKLQPIYGEYMSIYLPYNVVDVSDVRQVPDNQEVFTHPATDQSIIIEILEYVQGPNDQAIKTHYDDLVNSNDATDHQLIEIEEIPYEQMTMKQCEKAYFIRSQQSIAKFKEAATNMVHVHMGIFRLPQYDTDILVTFNDPVNISPDSSSHAPVQVGSQPWTMEDFKYSLQTLNLLNDGIFGC